MMVQFLYCIIAIQRKINKNTYFPPFSGKKAFILIILNKKDTTKSKKYKIKSLRKIRNGTASSFL